MIEIEHALQKVEHLGFRLPRRAVPLVDAVGFRLAQAALSDVDSPPFDKSMMDGFAVRSTDFLAGKADLEIIDRVMAGQMATKEMTSGQAIQIMTGAPVPTHADAVVMVEETREYEREGTPRVAIETTQLKDRQHILSRSATMASGDTVMPAGQRIRCEDVGPLAESGCGICQVFSKPSLAVIATGDELVPHGTVPSTSQIRNSNGPMLTAMAQRDCQQVSDLGIGEDNQESLSHLIARGLEHDVLVLSGGVSAGKLDLVPAVLETLGVKAVFHKVKIKPGKPIWFGVLENDDQPRKFVFGLPGNPVSSMVCYHVFVAPLLRFLAGGRFEASYVKSRLTIAHTQRPGRSTYWPARVDVTEQGWQATPLKWKGSADLKTLSLANGFVVLPAAQAEFAAGELLDTLLIPSDSP